MCLRFIHYISHLIQNSKFICLVFLFHFIELCSNVQDLEKKVFVSISIVQAINSK